MVDRRIYTAEEKDKMLMMEKQGHSPQQIGAHFGVDGDRIRKVLVRLHDKIKQQPMVAEPEQAPAHEEEPPVFTDAQPTRARRHVPLVMPKDFR